MAKLLEETEKQKMATFEDFRASGLLDDADDPLVQKYVQRVTNPCIRPFPPKVACQKEDDFRKNNASVIHVLGDGRLGNQLGAYGVTLALAYLHGLKPLIWFENYEVS